MRLKEFIIFIIIFTVLYIIFWKVFDYYMDKKSLEKRENDIKSFINLNKYQIFCNFYNLTPTVSENILHLMYLDIKQALNNDLVALADKYNLDINEVLIVVLYFEYLGIIGKRKVVVNNGCCVPLNEKEESLILKYSLLFSNKFDYETIISKGGLNADRELIYMSENYLMPGVILNGTNIYYVGDLNE